MFIPFSYLVVEELDLDVGIGRSRDVHLLQLPRLQYRHCMKERIKAPGISLLRHARPNSVCCCWACGDRSGEGPIPPPLQVGKLFPLPHLGPLPLPKLPWAPRIRRPGGRGRRKGSLPRVICPLPFLPSGRPPPPHLIASFSSFFCFERGRCLDPRVSEKKSFRLIHLALSSSTLGSRRGWRRGPFPPLRNWKSQKRKGEEREEGFLLLFFRHSLLSVRPSCLAVQPFLPFP